MNIFDVAKALSGISQKLIPKDVASHGLLSLIIKESRTFLAVYSDKFSCIVPVSIKHNSPADLECMVDGKLLSKFINKSKDETIDVEFIFNVEGTPSSLKISSGNNTNVSMPLSQPTGSLKNKKLCKECVEVSTASFISVIKSTSFAGSDIDAERPYYYALLGFIDKNISCICGNGSFFAYTKCEALKEASQEKQCILPIGVVNAIMPVLDLCDDDYVKFSFDDHSVVIQSSCMKFYIAVDKKSINWPDASSILNRNTGTDYTVVTSDLKEICSNIDLACESYDGKNNTLKCKLTTFKNSINFLVDGSCKVESHINSLSEDDESRDVTIDAVCIPMSMKSKMLGEKVTINIDASNFKGKSSPVLLTSLVENCVYKTFFAVT
jgi:hypothetical protein